MAQNAANYTILHLHSDLSNGTTNVDSVTKFKEYIQRASELGMTAMAFTEHGNIFEWYHKKQAIESAGMKYIHGVEAYLTESLDEKVRDNYHCILLARNKAGFRELNRLVSRSFGRDDNHFYYTPRISFDELEATSENIIVTTACLGGALFKGTPQAKERFRRFILNNRDRCFLEIQPHLVLDQIEYNLELIEFASQYHLRLTVGTDTHALDDRHLKGRAILQRAKKVNFGEEDGWDLTFKTYDQLCEMFAKQGISEKVYLEALENTNRIAEMIEPFEIDCSTKYPRIYEDSEQAFRDKIAAARAVHPYVNERYTAEELDEVIEQEFAVYKATKSIDFMLLQTYIREWERSNGILCGYGRGSVSGSMIAYILGITQMDSKKFKLNYFRFMNPSRVTNAD